MEQREEDKKRQDRKEKIPRKRLKTRKMLTREWLRKMQGEVKKMQVEVSTLEHMLQEMTDGEKRGHIGKLIHLYVYAKYQTLHCCFSVQLLKPMPPVCLNISSLVHPYHRS